MRTNSKYTFFVNIPAGHHDGYDSRFEVGILKTTCNNLFR